MHEMTVYRADAVFADLLIVDPGRQSRVVRRYSSAKFSPRLMSYGLMPAHPTLFLRREVYDAVGEYDARFRIAGDFEFCLRAFRSAPDRLPVQSGSRGQNDERRPQQPRLEEQVAHNRRNVAGVPVEWRPHQLGEAVFAYSDKNTGIDLARMLVVKNLIAIPAMPLSVKFLFALASGVDYQGLAPIRSGVR